MDTVEQLIDHMVSERCTLTYLPIPIPAFVVVSGVISDTDIGIRTTLILIQSSYKFTKSKSSDSDLIKFKNIIFLMVNGW